MSYFINIGPDCWSRRVISEAKDGSRRKLTDTHHYDENTSIDEMLRDAIITNFKSARSHTHKPIRKNSERYITRRIGPGRTENRWDSVAATDSFTNSVVDEIFRLIPQLKGSGALTGYVRYTLTNRWPNVFHFKKRDLNKLENAVNEDNDGVQIHILDHLLSQDKISKKAKENFLSFDKEKKLRNIESWKKQKAITNALYNEDSANEFLNASTDDEKLQILKQWATCSRPLTIPSTFIIRYCNNMQAVVDLVNNAHQINNKASDDSIDRQLKSGKYSQSAIADGITDEDKSMVRNIINALHDTHKDIRDYSPDEILDQDKKWNELFNNDDIDWNEYDDDE